MYQRVFCFFFGVGGAFFRFNACFRSRIVDATEGGSLHSKTYLISLVDTHLTSPQAVLSVLFVRTERIDCFVVRLILTACHPFLDYFMPRS